MPQYISDKRLYTDKAPTDPSAKIVEEGSPDANFLLAAEGAVVPEDFAKRFGLSASDSPDRARLLRETGSPNTVEEEQRMLREAEERGATEEARIRRQRLASTTEMRATSEPKGRK